MYDTQEIYFVFGELAAGAVLLGLSVSAHAQAAISSEARLAPVLDCDGRTAGHKVAAGVVVGLGSANPSSVAES